MKAIDDELIEKKKPRKQRKKKESEDVEELEGDGEFIEEPKGKGLFALSPEIQNKLVTDLVRLFLFSDAKKVVVRREDISKKVIKNYKGKNMLNQLLDEAKDRIYKTFGFEITQLPKVDPKGIVIQQTGVYILRRDPKLHEYMASIMKYAYSDHQAKRNSLLMIILGIIFINNEEIEETAFKNAVESINNDDFQLPSYVEQFIKEKYIDVGKKKGEAGTINIYKIGPRALAEVGKVNIFKFVSETCNIEVDPIRLKELEDTNEEDQNNEGE